MHTVVFSAHQIKLCCGSTTFSLELISIRCSQSLTTGAYMLSEIERVLMNAAFDRMSKSSQSSIYGLIHDLADANDSLQTKEINNSTVIDPLLSALGSVDDEIPPGSS